MTHRRCRRLANAAALLLVLSAFLCWLIVQPPIPIASQSGLARILLAADTHPPSKSVSAKRLTLEKLLPLDQLANGLGQSTRDEGAQSFQFRSTFGLIEVDVAKQPTANPITIDFTIDVNSDKFDQTTIELANDESGVLTVRFGGGSIQIAKADRKTPLQIYWYRGLLCVASENKPLITRADRRTESTVTQIRFTSRTKVTAKLTYQPAELRPSNVRQAFAKVRDLLASSTAKSTKDRIAELHKAEQLANNHREQMAIVLPTLYSDLGMAYRSLTQLKSATEMFQKGADAAAKHLTRVHGAGIRCELGLGSIQRAAGKVEEAYVAFKDLEDRARTVHLEPKLLADTKYNLALCSWLTNRQEAAWALARECRDIQRRQLELDSRHADMLVLTELLLGSFSYVSNDDAAAEETFAEALKTADAYPQDVRPTTRAQLVGTYGALLDKTGKVEQSRRMMRNALKPLRTADGSYRREAGGLLSNLGQNEFRAGEYDLGIMHLRDGIRVMEQGHGPLQQMLFNAWMNLASCYATVGDSDELAACLAKAKKIHEFHKWPPTHINTARIHIKDATVLRDSKRFEEALREYNTAEKIYSDHFDDHHMLASIYGFQQTMFRKLGDLDAAMGKAIQNRDMCGRLFPEFHRSNVSSLSMLLRLHFLKGETAEVIAKATKLSVLAESSARHHLPVLPIASRRVWVGSNLPMIKRIPGYLSLCGSGPQDVYQSVWRTKRLSARIHHLIEHAATDDDDARIQTDLRIQQQKLYNAILNTAAPRDELVGLAQKIAELEQDLAASNVTAKRELAQRDATLEDLFDRLPLDRALVDFAVVALPPEEDPDGPWQNHYFAFSIRSANGQPVVHQVDLGLVREIDRIAAEFSKDLMPSAGDRLRERLWTPVEKTLGDCKRITIVPERGLNCVPWAAIPGRRPNTYLLDEGYIFTQVGYAQRFCELLTRTEESKSVEQEICLVGDVDFGPQHHASQIQPDDKFPYPVSLRSGGQFRNWPTLPGSGEEVRELKKLFAKATDDPVQLLSGKDATDSKFLQRIQAATIVHVATHAFYSRPTAPDILPVDLRAAKLYPSDTLKSNSIASRNPLLLTGLALAGANVPDADANTDGIVLAEELSKTNLSRVFLMVFSACDSGTGELVGHDVIQGLSTAAHMAGVRNIVSSLWDVPDDSTVQLMKSFYQYHLLKDAPVDVALARAQADLLNQSRQDPFKSEKRGTNPAQVTPITTPHLLARLHPRRWAGFVVSGAGR